jgi:hypothetical protein
MPRIIITTIYIDVIRFWLTAAGANLYTVVFQATTQLRKERMLTNAVTNTKCRQFLQTSPPVQQLDNNLHQHPHFYFRIIQDRMHIWYWHVLLTATFY